MTAMPTLRFALVDVFADTVLTGNPLAVVDGEHGLSDDVLADVAQGKAQSGHRGHRARPAPCERPRSAAVAFSSA